MKGKHFSRIHTQSTGTDTSTGCMTAKNIIQAIVREERWGIIVMSIIQKKSFCSTSLSIPLLGVVLALSLILMSCDRTTEYSVIKRGIHFSKIHTSSSGVSTGRMTVRNIIQGIPCEEGWVHFKKDGGLLSCQLYTEYTLKNVTLPAHTWIHLPYHDHQTGFVCSLPHDQEIQGFLCEGTGGYKGTHTSFYETGKLRSFYPVRELIVSGVPCKATPFVNVQLHENGSLKSCKLSADYTIQNTEIKKGEIIEFTKDMQLK